MEEEGCDNCYKFDYIWKCLVKNVNFLTEDDNLDLCGENIIWATVLYCEIGAGVTGRSKNKPGVTKGGQTFLHSDDHIMRPCAYIQRHHLNRRPSGWAVMGKIEVNNIMDDIKPTIQGEVVYIKIFKDNTNYNLNNYFRGEKVSYWIILGIFCGTFT